MATSYPPILQPAMQRIAELEIRVADLNMRLNAISTMLGLPTDSPIILSSTVEDETGGSGDKRSNPNPDPVSGTFYSDTLTFVNNEPIFPINHVSNDSMDAAYSLKISGDNAKFKLLEDESAFEFLSGDLSLYIESVAESDNEYDLDVIGVVTKETGEAAKTDKGWKVTKKAKISYKKEQ